MAGNPEIQRNSPARSSPSRIRVARRRFIPGAEAIAGAEQKIADLKAQVEASRDLSTSLAFD